VREYYLQLPIGYDANKPYPLFIEGTGNGGKGNQLYQLPALAGTAIRVGLTPPPPEIGHSTNPNQACYDDREGDDSVEFPFYEGLYDRLAFTVCFDRNRVFAGGPSSSCGGAWLANELGCKYAGDPDRPVRGVMVNNGGLPTDVKFAPTCTKKPMAGIWVHSIGNTSSPFSGNIVAMNRALAVNGCLPVGVTYATATFEPFPITATDGFSCKRFTGCPAATPLVVCPLPLNDTSLHEGVVNPAWSTFFKLFQAPPLLGP
jgi:poly(3-hydroxybutyrate) depolymerase